LKELATGKIFRILNENFLVVALIHAIIGDIPARKSLVGMKESVSCTYPCHFCKVPSLDLSRIITHNECSLYSRRMQDLSSLKRLQPGSPAPEVMNISYNIVRVSELNQWPVQINPQCILNDLMHQKYLGDYAQHFLEFVKEVGRENDMTGSALWSTIQSHYSSYCTLNKIHSYTKIKNAQSWKGLKAYGIRRFSEFAPYLFIKLGWINTPNLTILFNAFCIQSQIILGLSQHSISLHQLDKLQSLIEKQLNFFSEEENFVDSRSFITLNTHLDLHWIPMIKGFGVPRSYWCFVFEGMIKDLKRYFKNVNNKQVSWSVFNRHMTKGVLKLLGEKIGFSEPVLQSETFVDKVSQENNEVFSTPLQVLKDSSIGLLKNLDISNIVVRYTKISVGHWVLIGPTDFRQHVHLGLVKYFLKDQNDLTCVAYMVPMIDNEAEVVCDGLLSIKTFSKRVIVHTVNVTSISNILKNCYLMDWTEDLFLLINQVILA
jgi:hypothetical protein